MIQSYGNQGTADIHAGAVSKAARAVLPVALWPKARLVLDRIDVAASVGDLRLPPSMRLHQLAGDLAGWWSVSINAKFRVIFIWENGHACKVQIVDYH